MTPMDVDELSVVLPTTTTSSLSLLLYVETNLAHLTNLTVRIQSSTPNSKYLRALHAIETSDEIASAIW